MWQDVASPTTPAEDPDSSIPFSLVAHWLFCERRAWLEAVGETVDSYQMEIGTKDHQSVDDFGVQKGERYRAVNVRDPRLGVHGRIDLFEKEAGGEITLVEYKATPVRRVPEVTRPMRIQLMLQSLALHNAGIEVMKHEVYFTTHKKRVSVQLDDSDAELAREAVVGVRTTIQSAVAPPALIDDSRCMRCSHAAVCLPDERQDGPADRRIGVADPTGHVVHLATYGSRASIREGRLRAEHRGELVAEVPLEDVHAIVIHGNCDISSGLVRELLWRGKQIVWASGRGKVVGWAAPAHLPNTQARVSQYSRSMSRDLRLAREFVYSKIANQATLLRRNGHAAQAVEGMRNIQASVKTAESIETVLGYEGAAAKLYFGNFLTMFNGQSLSFLETRFPGRIGRGATDPLNVCLNYAYGILSGEVLRAIVACGLDPYAGFLHSSGRGKPALVLDLMEEFRAPIADSAVVGAFNNGEMGRKSFVVVLDDYRLTDQGRKKILEAMERRCQSVFTHPRFEYKVSWRRAMEVQARLVLGVIDGTQSSYSGVRVR